MKHSFIITCFVYRSVHDLIVFPIFLNNREEEDRRLNLLNHQIHVSNEFDEPKAGMNIIRAHPVPIESQIPLFDKIMAEQENRYTQNTIL